MILEVLAIALGAQLYEDASFLLPSMVVGLGDGDRAPLLVAVLATKSGPRGRFVGFDRRGRRRADEMGIEITGVSADPPVRVPYARLLASEPRALWLPFSTDDTDGLRDLCGSALPGRPSASNT